MDPFSLFQADDPSNLLEGYISGFANSTNPNYEKIKEKIFGESKEENTKENIKEKIKEKIFGGLKENKKENKKEIKKEIEKGKNIENFEGNGDNTNNHLIQSVYNIKNKDVTKYDIIDNSGHLLYKYDTNFKETIPPLKDAVMNDTLNVMNYNRNIYTITGFAVALLVIGIIFTSKKEILKY
jgi:hypothetical protein